MPGSQRAVDHPLIPPKTQTYVFKHLKLCLHGATGKQHLSLKGTRVALEIGDPGSVAGQGGRVSAPSHCTAQT